MKVTRKQLIEEIVEMRTVKKALGLLTFGPTSRKQWFVIIGLLLMCFPAQLTLLPLFTIDLLIFHLQFSVFAFPSEVGTILLIATLLNLNPLTKIRLARAQE